MSNKKAPALNPNQPVSDRIVMLLNLGFTEAETFTDIQRHCKLSIVTKQSKQELADTIAQIKRLNVFATGVIPAGL
jgi:hypothetical protein